MTEERFPTECISSFRGVLSELYQYTIRTVFAVAESGTWFSDINVYCFSIAHHIVRANVEVCQLKSIEDWVPVADGTRTSLVNKNRCVY